MSSMKNDDIVVKYHRQLLSVTTISFQVKTSLCKLNSPFKSGDTICFC